MLEDPRYQAFVERYHADPLRFAVEVTGFMPSADQMDLFQSITALNAKVPVVSGTGKTASFARIAIANGPHAWINDFFTIPSPARSSATPTTAGTPGGWSSSTSPSAPTTRMKSTWPATW